MYLGWEKHGIQTTENFIENILENKPLGGPSRLQDNITMKGKYTVRLVSEWTWFMITSVFKFLYTYIDFPIIIIVSAQFLNK